MNFKELFEGVEPKMPGAPEGIQIMTPQQFVAKAGDMPDEEVGEADDGLPSKGRRGLIRGIALGALGGYGLAKYNNEPAEPIKPTSQPTQSKQTQPTQSKQTQPTKPAGKLSGDSQYDLAYKFSKYVINMYRIGYNRRLIESQVTRDLGPQFGELASKITNVLFDNEPKGGWTTGELENLAISFAKSASKVNESFNEGEEHLSRIRKLSGLEEATKLPASSREFGGDEFQDYMKRIVGTPDIDKKTGQVKTDKKGNEKYVSGKTKTDRYKMPYIHRSSVVEYLGPDGQTYSEDKIKQALAQRPKALLKQNEKMKHSNGELEQFFNVGFAALTGIALDEDTNKLIIVNTCPGAGSCKVDCFAMKGGKVQFKAAWLSDGRILTYLLNDPDGFFNQLSAEISKEEKLGQKGGYTVTIRWHDAGDFFSPEYLDMALKMAAKHPDTKFYAYTKMAGAALGAKPPNFIINWSEGANTGQEKQVKAQDASLSSTKNSRIVPDDLFQDLLVKDEKKNLVKGSSGQWQVQPNKLPELKNRLAKEYGLSANSILDYNEYMAKRKSIPAGMKYNVIVAPGEGDISANDPNIISTLLLKH